MPRPTIIYVEFLTVKRWLFDIVPPLRTHVRKNSTDRPCCYIFDATPLSLWMVRCWSFFEGFYVEKLDFRCLDVRDEEGISIFLRLMYQDCWQIQNFILHDADFQSFSRGLNASTNGALFLFKHFVVYDFYGPRKYTLISHALMLTKIARWHLRRQAIESAGVSLYVNQRPWQKQLNEYAQSYGVSLQALKPVRLRRWQWVLYKKKLAKLNWRLLKSLILYKVFSWKLKHRLIQEEPYFTTDTSRILTENSGHLNVDDPGRHSDVFFINEQGVEPQDVMLAFYSAVDPIDNKKYALLKSNKIAAVALSPQSCTVNHRFVPVFQPQVKKANHTSINPKQIHNNPQQDYLQDTLKQYHHLCAYWREFFQKYNIKVYTSWNKNEANHIAITDVLRELGGISANYQRSYESHSSPLVAVNSDIIFGHSFNGHTVHKNNGSRFHYHIVVGYLGDYRFEALRPFALKLRQKLMAHGAKHLIAYFDENTIPDGRWYTGHAGARENYTFWLNKVLNSPDLGIIFKPKQPGTLKKRLGPVVFLLEQAMATGRCTIFEEGMLQGSFPPAAAALAADIAIHESLYAGTAGVEAALAGIPSLLVDLEGWGPSPLYNLGPGVVFKDWQSVWEACCAFFKDPITNRYLGNWSDHIHELDPFRDGKAALRMSQYLKWLLEGLKKGQRPEDVLFETAQCYADRWGKDKVQPGPLSQ